MKQYYPRQQICSFNSNGQRKSVILSLRGTFIEGGTRTLGVHSTIGEQSPCKLLFMLPILLFHGIEKKQARKGEWLSSSSNGQLFI